MFLNQVYPLRKKITNRSHLEHFDQIYNTYLDKIYFVVFQDWLNFSSHIYATPITDPVIITNVLLINIVLSFGTTNLIGWRIRTFDRFAN